MMDQEELRVFIRIAESLENIVSILNTIDDRLSEQTAYTGGKAYIRILQTETI